MRKFCCLIALQILLCFGPAGFASAQDTPPASSQPTAATPPGETDQPPPRTLGDDIVEKVRQAKSIGVILIVMSVLGVGFALERFMHLRRDRFAPDNLAEKALGRMLVEDFEGARALCRAPAVKTGSAPKPQPAKDSQPTSILGQVIDSMVKHRDFSFNEIGTVAEDIVSREVRQEMQKAYPIAVVATLAPLLGLLGTVIGMINSFEAVALAGSMGDPSIMASDISFALVTTAMGLIVAAPNLALYHYFRMKTNALTARLDEQVSELVSDWHIGRMNARARGPEPSASQAPSARPGRPANNDPAIGQAGKETTHA